MKIYTINSEGPLNTLSSLLLEDLRDFFKANPDEAIVLRSDKKDFVVGADISGFLPIFKQGPDALRSYLESVHELMDLIENHPKATIALINGNCLGGGLELALACDYRMATPDAKFAFPEVKLGIIPGWGGCVRAPRIIGFENAATLITSGKTITAQEALDLRLIDSLVDKLEAPAWLNYSSGAVDKREIKQKPMPYVSPVELEMAYQTIMAVAAPKFGPYIAPKVAIQVMYESLLLRTDQAKDREIKGLLEVAYGGQADGLINTFFLDQRIKKLQGKPFDKKLKVGVIGGGVMGRGIAYQSAKKGMDVVIKEISYDACTAVKKAIDELKPTEGCIGYTEHFEPLAECDIVIEAAVEDLVLKNQIFDALRYHGYSGIIATNTSSIPLSLMPKADIGLHYFNPVHRMPLVEIVRGMTTDEEIEFAKRFVATQGKTGIVVEDCAGFLVNRCLIPYLNTCIRHIDEGVSWKELDRIAVEYGWPMGPAKLLDTIGLDIAAHVAPVMTKAYPKNEAMKLYPTSFIYDLIKDGHLGYKTGGGIQKYHKCDIIGDPNEAFDDAMNAFEDEVRECIREGIVGSKDEAMISMIMGIGFPPFKEIDA